MSVFGIDFGNANSLIAVARRSGIDVIANEVSNRETPSYVSFGPKVRYLGEGGLNQEVMNFKNTAANLKRLIGRKWSDPELQEELKEMTIKAKPTQNDEWVVEVMYQNEVVSFSPERLVSMLFGKLKKITETELKTSVCDCVLSVPGYFTDHQRRAIFSAAHIAGLNPLRLMNELTATALSYALFRTEQLPETEPINVMFVDFGQSVLSVGISSVTKNKLKMLSTTYENFGGRDYDRFLTNHFASIFKTKPGIDIHSNPRAKLRLRLACEKLKKVLSANAEAVLNIECLMDDKDVRAVMKRDEFYELTKELNQRLLLPVQRALAEAKLTTDQIHSVEVVGGGSRMPLFQKTLSEFLGKELSRTINGSEAVARGCALQCAMLSPTFRVKEFKVEDISLYPIKLSWRALGVGGGNSGADATTTSAAEGEGMEVEDGGSNEGSVELFVHNNPVPSIKQIAFPNKKEGMEFSLSYSPSPLLPPGTPSLISRHVIPPLQQKGEEVPKIQLKVKMNLHGIVQVDSLQSLETVVEEVEVVEEKKVPAGGAAATGTEAQPTGDAAGAAGAATEGAGAAPATEVVKEKRMEKRKKVHKVDLAYQPPSILSSLVQEDINKWAEEEGKMRSADKLADETADRKNALESYILNVRKRVGGGDLHDYVTDSEREPFLQKLQEAEDWLYTEEGDDATKSTYVEKLVGLQKIGHDFEARKKEDDNTKELFEDIRNAIDKLKQSLPQEKYSHIEQAEKEKVVEKCQAMEQQIQEWEAKKKSHPKTEKPIVVVADVTPKKKEFEKFCNDILSKPKPIPKPEEKKEEKKEDKKEEKKDDKKDEKDAKGPTSPEGGQNMEVEK